MIRRLGVISLLAVGLVSLAAAMGDQSLPDYSSSVFAVEVVSARIQECRNIPLEDLSGILGPPLQYPRYGTFHPRCIFVTTNHVALARESQIVVRMEAPFANGSGIDIRAYDYGTRGELAISVSSDLSEWHYLGSKIRKSEETFIGFDLGELEGPFLYIRLRGYGSNYGPRIAAVEALYPIEE